MLLEILSYIIILFTGVTAGFMLIEYCTGET